MQDHNQQQPGNIDLSIIIPCYNEALVIEETVNNIREEFIKASISYEILCVNNNSSDNTEQVLQSLAASQKIRYVNTPKIQGYGAAVRWGIECYVGDAAIIVMADGSEDPKDIHQFYRKLAQGYDCVFGDRFSQKDLVEDYPKFKLLLNRLGNRLISLVTGKKYGDFTNGFKCYTRQTLNKMQPLYADHFNLTIEMSMCAVLSGANYAVVPNSWKDRLEGESKFKLLSQSKLYLLTILYCKLRTYIQGDNWHLFKKSAENLSQD